MEGIMEKEDGAEGYKFLLLVFNSLETNLQFEILRHFLIAANLFLSLHLAKREILSLDKFQLDGRA